MTVDERLLSVFRYHFLWLWETRHANDLVRHSLRDNMRGQRIIKKRMNNKS